MNEASSDPSPPAKFAGKVAAVVLALVVLALVALFGLEGVDRIPDKAIVYVDESNTYYSPPLLWEDSRSFHILMSVEQVRHRSFRHVSRQPSTDREWEEVTQEFKLVWVHNQDKTWTEFRPRHGICVLPVQKGATKGTKEYSPDRIHVNAGGFYGKSHCLLFHLIGLNESRWSADGTWKW